MNNALDVRQRIEKLAWVTYAPSKLRISAREELR